MARSIRAAGSPRRRHRSCGLRLRPFHRRGWARITAPRNWAAPCAHVRRPDRQVQLIQDFKPNIIMVTPSYMLNIADEMERQGIDPAPACGSSSGPSLGPRPCAKNWKRASVSALDIYGLSEVMEPRRRHGVHRRTGPPSGEDHFYPEIINPETGGPRRRVRRAGIHFAHQGSVAHRALPHRDLTRLLPGHAPHAPHRSPAAATTC